ncbi:phospholipase D2 [Tachysurus ichikawai]
MFCNLSHSEGFILKRSGGHRIHGLNCFGHHQFCFRWSHRWLVVKDSFLLYMSRDPGLVSFVLLFDPELKVLVDRRYTDTKHGVCIETVSRSGGEIASRNILLSHSLNTNFYLSSPR